MKSINGREELPRIKRGSEGAAVCRHAIKGNGNAAGEKYPEEVFPRMVCRAEGENAVLHANMLSKVYELFMTDLPGRAQMVYTK